MGKLLNEPYLKQHSQNLSEIEYRKTLAHNSYIPPERKSSMSLRKSKPVLQGRYYQASSQSDEITLRSKQFSVSTDEKGRKNLIYFQDPVVEECYGQREKNHTESLPSMSKLDHEQFIQSPVNISSAHSKNTSFSSNNRKIQALIQKQMLEDKAIDSILQKKGLTPQNQLKRSQTLNSFLSDKQNTKLPTQISAIPENTGDDYFESEEYMVRYFNLNLNAEQKADNFQKLEAAKKMRLPHISLIKSKPFDDVPPPLGFYNPNYQQFIERLEKNQSQLHQTAKNVIFGKSMYHSKINMNSPSPIRNCVYVPEKQNNKKKSQFDIMKKLVNDIYEENKKIKEKFSKRK